MANENTSVSTKVTFSHQLATVLKDNVGALPDGFNKERFVQNSLALLNDTPKLAKFPKPQIISGLMKGAYLGVDFFNKEAYLIPYGTQLNFQLDYKGAKKIAKQHSVRPIKEIYAEVVRDGDIFSIDVDNGDRHVVFKPQPFSNKEVVGAFAVAVYEDGGILTDMMSKEELENTRKHSKSADYGPWVDFTNEMYKKTVLKRLCKQIEISFDNPEQTGAYMDDNDLETDVRKIHAEEVKETANTEDFTYDVDATEIIEGEVVDVTEKGKKSK
jgi:recombination protein RecT